VKVAALIPAYNEADRIADTVRAARILPGVSEVVVVDDGSSDATSDEARSAGADQVIRLDVNSGKGAAMMAGIRSTDAQVLLFLDADLAGSASAAAVLLEPVISDRADMTVAVFPKVTKSGGFGFAVGLARWGIRKFTGQTMAAPISGQRAVRREILDRIGKFDPGFGIEAGLTIDALRMGYRVEEVPVNLSHRSTGRDLRGFLHRGKQFRDIGMALFRRLGWRKKNFRGDEIPSVCGLYLVIAGLIGAVAGRYTPFGSDPAARLYFAGILGFGLLGLADDLFGSREVGGFRGHFKKLLVGRRLTTGAAKAIGGGLLALWLGYEASGGGVLDWALDTAAIALAANTINLLDLRPGRAISAFFSCLIGAVLLAWGKVSAPVPLAAVAVAAAGLAFFDSRGKAMLGDVGSNALGAVIGLTIALDAKIEGKIAAVVVFLLINAYSERYSISKLIERRPVLKWIDSKLGVR
jgi:glycosyltransferase involved in cell wall biosynthesis